MMPMKAPRQFACEQLSRWADWSCAGIDPGGEHDERCNRISRIVEERDEHAALREAPLAGDEAFRIAWQTGHAAGRLEGLRTAAQFASNWAAQLRDGKASNPWSAIEVMAVAGKIAALAEGEVKR